MSELANRLIESVIEREGGYVNDPTDRGGETNFGITEKVARGYGYKGAMDLLPYELAFKIYKDRYWTPLKLDNISVISEDLTEQLFDFGVNSGTATAARQLQQLLNVLNNKQTIYPDVLVDGVLGSKTLYALLQYAEHRTQDSLRILTEALRAIRISYCVDIAINDQSQEKYSFGWLTRIVNL